MDRGRDGDGGQLVAEPEPVELAHGVWQQVDADAERRSSRARSMTVDVEAPGVQVERGGQAADARAGDEDRFQFMTPALGEPRVHKSNTDLAHKL